MLKRYSSALLSLIFLLVSGCAPAIKNLDSKGKNIICFGDSLTYGTGAPDGEGYPFVLARLLNKDVINTGVPGDKTETALLRLQSDVLENDPYVVIVELGGNDFLEKVPKERTLRNLEEIIAEIQAAGAIVALCDLSSGIMLSGYRSDYGQIAGKTGSVFIPRLMEGILNNESLKSDPIHPNAEGYKIMAKRIYEAIKPYVDNMEI